MSQAIKVPDVDVESLRDEVRSEYAEVAANPQRGFHFHTGRPLAKMLGYDEALLQGLPEGAVESFAGTGNPFSLGALNQAERVVDIGAGAGIDSLIAGRLVGPAGRVIGVDMTPEMLAKARKAAQEAEMDHLEFREGLAEALPVDDAWANIVISNGVINLCPDKPAVFGEIYRVLMPGGRLQIGDISVQTPVPDDAKRNTDLWKG
ncbi:MAG: methyltransferase domain-containing protein [Gemmatimonadota bacterium]